MNTPPSSCIHRPSRCVKFITQGRFCCTIFLIWTDSNLACNSVTRQMKCIVSIRFVFIHRCVPHNHLSAWTCASAVVVLEPHMSTNPNAIWRTFTTNLAKMLTRTSSLLLFAALYGRALSVSGDILPCMSRYEEHDQIEHQIQKTRHFFPWLLFLTYYQPISGLTALPT